MTIQLGLLYRNNLLDTFETTVSVSPKLWIFTGSPPANCAAVDSGSIIIAIDLPSDWMSVASNGSKVMTGGWSGSATISGSATAGHFRIKNNGGSVVHMQGTSGSTGSGADMILNDVDIYNQQFVTVVTFNLIAPGA